MTEHKSITNGSPDQVPEQKAKTQEESHLPRRAIFGGGLGALIGLIGQACSSTSFNGSNGKSSSLHKESQTGGGVDAGGKDSGGATAGGADTNGDATGSKDAGGSTAGGSTAGGTTAGGTGGVGGNGDVAKGNVGDGSDQSSGCFANTQTQIDLSQTPAASADMKPAVKFYGRMDSALVAIQFSAPSTPIRQVILATPGGYLLAMHCISSADMKADGSYRPIVIDNVWLKENGSDISQLKILIQTDSAKCAHTEPVAFFTTFQGKSVIDLSARTVPSGMIGHQSVTRFAEARVGAEPDPNAFNVDKAFHYPFGYGNPDDRYLRTITSSSTFTPVVSADGIQGTVTDIMGNVISLNGGAIIEYQVFCTYVDNGTSMARTILHIG